MKTLQEHINEKLVINKSYEKPKIKVNDFFELKKLIASRSEECADNDNYYLDLSDIDVSNINRLVDPIKYGSVFEGAYVDYTEFIDVTGWDVKHIKYFNNLFRHFNSLEKIIGIEDWTICNDANVNDMFYGCKKLKEKGNIPSWYYEIINKK